MTQKQRNKTNTFSWIFSLKQFSLNIHNYFKRHSNFFSSFFKNMIFNWNIISKNQSQKKKKQNQSQKSNQKMKINTKWRIWRIENKTSHISSKYHTMIFRILLSIWGQGEVSTPSECCSLRVSFLPQAAFLQRSISADLVGFPPSPES